MHAGTVQEGVEQEEVWHKERGRGINCNKNMFRTHTCHTKGYIRAMTACAHEDSRLYMCVCVCMCVDGCKTGWSMSMHVYVCIFNLCIRYMKER